MPLINYRSLPSYDRLIEEGVQVQTQDLNTDLDLPEIHIGFLNMMPDKAFHATERQFLRLIAAGGVHGRLVVHPFTVGGFERDIKIKNYIASYYESFSQVRAKGVNALVLTGANPALENMEEEEYWHEFVDVVLWADAHVHTCLCSCLATHAVVKLFHGIERTLVQPGKRWGVYSHHLTDEIHSLVAGIEQKFYAPHSHVYEVASSQLQECGIRILSKSPEADVHLAVSEDGFKWVYLQGHPEYDAVSLLKEYKREVARFISGDRTDYPPLPEYYFGEKSVAHLTSYREELLGALESNSQLPEFPEEALASQVSNCWRPHGEALFNNWIAQVAEFVRSGSRHQSVLMSA